MPTLPSSATTAISSWRGYWTKKIREASNANESAGRNPERREEIKLLVGDAVSALGSGVGGVRLLDIGSGEGFLSREIPSSETVCLDFVSAALRGDGGQHANRGVCGELSRLPFGAESFGAVFCGSALHYVPVWEVRTILKETYRVLSPGGVAFFQAIPDAKFKAEYLKGCPLDSYDDNERATWWSPRALHQLAYSEMFAPQILEPDSRLWHSWYMFDLLLRKEA